MQVKIKFDSSWKALIDQLHEARVNMPKVMHRIIAAEGEALRAEMIRGIRDQAPGGKPFLKLNKLTLITRQLRGFRGKKILTVSAQLIAGIRVKAKGTEAFVGVTADLKRTERGQQLWRVARLQEYGGVIVMRRTPRMMRFLMVLLRKARMGRTIRRRSKRSGRFLKGRWQPAGAAAVRSKNTAQRGSRGVIVVRVPARPYMQPALRVYQGAKAKIARRALEAMQRALAGKLKRGTTKRAG